MMRSLLALLISLSACGGSTQGTATQENGSSAADYRRWHTEKMDVDLAVAEAINQPEGGDYAKAVEITRASNFPPEVKEFDIGQLIIGGIARRSSKPATETLQQGLEMIENATTARGEIRSSAIQQMRIFFERGDGIAPNNIPVDPLIAECWRRIENGKADDPARCIALRRERLPRVGR